MKTSCTKLGICLLLLGAIAGCASGQSSRWDPVRRMAPPRTFACPRATGPIKIDGKLDETAWKKAGVIKNFWLTDRGPLASSQTTVYVLWDRDNLYLAAVAEDQDVWCTLTERDAMLWQEDVLEFFFKPREDSRHYYEFQFSPTGVILDAFWPSRSRVNLTLFAKPYNPDLEIKTQVDGTLGNWEDQDRSWTLELRIPFSAFAKTCPPPQAGEKWLFAACRYDFSAYLEKTEISSSARLATGSFHTYQCYDYLEFVKEK